MNNSIPAQQDDSEEVQLYSSGLAESTSPSANDVLAQQLGTKYSDVEQSDRQELQKDLLNQTTDTTTPDNVNPTDGQVA